MTPTPHRSASRRMVMASKPSSRMSSAATSMRWSSEIRRFVRAALGTVTLLTGSALDICRTCTVYVQYLYCKGDDGSPYHADERHAPLGGERAGGAVVSG